MNSKTTHLFRLTNIPSLSQRIRQWVPTYFEGKTVPNKEKADQRKMAMKTCEDARKSIRIALPFYHINLLNQLIRGTPTIWTHGALQPISNRY